MTYILDNNSGHYPLKYNVFIFIFVNDSKTISAQKCVSCLSILLNYFLNKSSI